MVVTAAEYFWVQEEAVLDDVIDRLLDVRNGRPGKQVQLTEQEIRQLCLTAKEIFMSQPNLLELEAPIKICGGCAVACSSMINQRFIAGTRRLCALTGDIHGQYSDLLRLFEYGGFPPEANYLFLGDYVDRGKQSLETICLLLAYKVWAELTLPVQMYCAAVLKRLTHPSCPAGQVPRKFLSAAGQPRVRLDQPDIRLLRRVQAAVQRAVVEDVHRLLQLPPRGGAGG